MLEYAGEKVIFEGNHPFELISETNGDDLTRLTLKINEGKSVNDVLHYMLPKVSIQKLEEVVPTMNEIFIRTVSKSR